MKHKVTVETDDATVSIELHGEGDCSIFDLVETSIRPAIAGLGFHHDNIEEAFG